MSTSFPPQSLPSWDGQWEHLGNGWLNCSQGPYVFIIGVFCCSLPTLSQSWGTGGGRPGPIPRPWRTLWNKHTCFWNGGGATRFPEPASRWVQTTHADSLTDIKYTPLHSGVPILPSSLLGEHPFSLVPECSLHLKRSHRHCCWPDPGFLFSLHICESPCPLAKQPNPRHTLGPWFMETGFFKNLLFCSFSQLHTAGVSLTSGPWRGREGSASSAGVV